VTNGLINPSRKYISTNNYKFCSCKNKYKLLSKCFQLYFAGAW